MKMGVIRAREPEVGGEGPLPPHHCTPPGPIDGSFLIFVNLQNIESFEVIQKKPSEVSWGEMSSAKKAVLICNKCLFCTIIVCFL